MHEIIVAAAVCAGVTAAAACFWVALAILRSDRAGYDRMRLRTRSIVDVVKGDVSTSYDGARDYQVAAGIAIDKKRNRWVEQGKISNEAIANILQ